MLQHSPFPLRQHALASAQLPPAHSSYVLTGLMLPLGPESLGVVRGRQWHYGRVITDRPGNGSWTHLCRTYNVYMFSSFITHSHSIRYRLFCTSKNYYQAFGNREVAQLLHKPSRKSAPETAALTAQGDSVGNRGCKLLLQCQTREPDQTPQNLKHRHII